MAVRLQYACVRLHVSVCQVFTQTFMSHLFTKISAPNLQGMFIAVKTCLCKILALF